MKKILLSLLLTLSLYSSTSQPASAQWAVFDAANFGANLPTSVSTAADAATNSITTIQQTLDTVNKTILIPMRDALTLIQIFQNSKMITALITGSMGADPLLVTNPELYLKNKGIAITQGGIDALAKQNGIFSNSIIGSVVISAKFNSSSLTFKLNNINKSNIPSITQGKICNDDAALSQMARSDTTLTGTDYTARKAELYDKLCRCDPRADTDAGKLCAKKLTTLSSRNPSLDSFYAITQGDNAYTKAELTKLAIAQDAATKKEQAKADLAAGGGIKSKTTCTKVASNGGCIEQVIDQAGSILKDAYEKALGSGLATAISSFGSGAGSLIGTIFTTINLVQGIQTSLGGNSSGGGGRSTTVAVSTSTSTPTTHNTTQTTTAGFTQDLVNNPQTRAVLSAAPMDQLNYHKEQLAKLTATDNSYISAIDSYNSQLGTLEACFDNLIRDYPDDTTSGSSAGNQIASAKSFVLTGVTTNNATKASLNAELAKISETNTLIASTINTLQTSNSTDEITSTFQNYQNQLRDRNLPNLTSGVAREGDRLMFNSSVQVSTMQGGQYYNLNATCGTIRQQIEQSRFSGGGA